MPVEGNPTKNCQIIKSSMRTIKLSDICTAYLEGYIYAKITEHLIAGKIKSSNLDALKKLAVESMKEHIESYNEVLHRIEIFRKRKGETFSGETSSLILYPPTDFNTQFLDFSFAVC